MDPLADDYPSWSPYNYALNNPLSLTDPTGECPYAPGSGKCVAFYLGAAKGAWNSLRGTVKGVAALADSDTYVALGRAAKQAYNDPEGTAAALMEAGKQRLVRAASSPEELGKLSGELSFTVGEVLLGTKGVTKLGKVAATTRASRSIRGMKATSRILHFTERNLQKGFTKHGADFGLSGNWNPSRAAEFSAAVNKHVNSSNVRAIPGSYRGKSGYTHFLDPETQVNVVVDSENNYVTGYRLSNEQIDSIIYDGHLW